MPTGNETVKTSARIAEITDPGETPTASEMNHWLLILNAMLNSWATSGLNVYASVKENFSLVSGTANYTIGSGGTFNTTRPDLIQMAHIRDGNYDYPIEIIDERKYVDILDKTTQGRPEYLFYHPEYPLGTIYLYYTPDSAYDLYLYSRKQLTQVVATTEYDYPPGVDEAIYYNLAVRIGDGIPPQVPVIAKSSFDRMVSMSVRNNMKEAQLEVTKTRNIGRNILTF